MENKRRIEKNSIQTRIQNLKTYITSSNNSVNNLRLQSANDQYNLSQIQKLKEKVTKYENELQELSQKLNDIQIGLLDDEIKEKYKDVALEIKTKEEETSKKKLEKKTHDQKNSQISKNIYNQQRNFDYKVRQSKREMDRSYMFFCRTIDSIPDYIINKLKKMPNNKGYIWKNIYCYGELPSDSNTITLFEKRRDNILLIHEWVNNTYNIWKKESTNRKTLSSSSIKYTRKLNENLLSDYIKK